MEDYEIFVYEHTLYLLFDMLEQYDIGDEVCRKTLHKLINDILLKYTFHSRMLDKLMTILANLHNKNSCQFTEEIGMLVSNIREPFITVEPSEQDKREHDFQVSLK